ncbi:MAG TPA: PAS domain-containing sensor histidine kinase [Candidatus Binatia bacterium]|nr:PAS domain-containing sensor histidine kinase [Candidatus Binatia bacterium]
MTSPRPQTAPDESTPTGPASTSAMRRSEIGAEAMYWLLHAPLAWLTWIYALAVAIAVPLVLPATAHERGLWWDGMDLTTAAIAGAQWLLVARGNRDRVGPAAFFIAGGLAAWWLNEVVWTICDVTGSKAALFPSLNAVGFVLFLPLLGLGLVLYIQRAVSRWFTVPLLCDLGVVAATFVVLVGFPMNDLLKETEMNLAARVTAIGFPILALVLVAFTVYCLIAFGWGARRWTLSLMLAGGTLIVGADFLYALGLIYPEFDLGAVLDPFWSIGFALISLAAFEHGKLRETGSAPPVEATERRLRRLRQLLPAAGLIAVIGAVIADSEGFNLTEGLTILLPATALFAVSIAMAAFWNRRQIVDLEGRSDAATKAWHRAEARFGTLLEFAPDPTLILDRQGRIRAAGKGLEDVFGLAREEVLGRPVTVLSAEFADAMPAAMLARLAEAAPGGDTQSCRFALTARRKSGAPFPVEGVVFHLEGDGALLGLMLRDVTERRETELALRTAKENAELADRSKSEFLANMSHELRTPLNAIIGFSDIIEAHAFGPDDPRYRDYARDIGASGRHLLGILKDILDFARIETRDIKLRESECSIPEVIESCLRILGLRAREAGVEVSVGLPADLPLLYADGVKIKQVLLNLISNAIKFTPRDGHVRVTATLPAAGGIEISVADTGIGIRAEDIPLVFSPFGQVASAFCRSHDGIGLGLPLSRRLAELHGGRIEIDSQPGEGTVVTLWLPPERTITVLPAVRAGRQIAAG